MKYNIIRIDGTTKKKHIVHPGYETQRGAKDILHDMVKAYLRHGLVLTVFELSFITEGNGDIFRVEEASEFKVAA